MMGLVTHRNSLHRCARGCGLGQGLTFMSLLVVGRQDKHYAYVYTHLLGAAQAWHAALTFEEKAFKTSVHSVALL